MTESTEHENTEESDVEGGEVRRGNWDTTLTTSTTPDSAIDNWGRPPAPAPAPAPDQDNEPTGPSPASGPAQK